MGRFRHALGVAGAVVLVLIVLAAIFAPELAPFSPDQQFADRHR